MRQRHVKKLIDQFARQEQDFLRQKFLAPAIRNGFVQVKLDGVVCRMRIGPSDFEGFGIFEPLSMTEAILEREASLREKQAYFQLFPKVNLIVTRRIDAHWLGIAACQGDRRIQVQGTVPVLLTNAVQQFDVVTCRFDGAAFWFDRIDARTNPAFANGLREAFAQNVEPQDLEIRGLPGEMRMAYELAHWVKLNPQSKSPRKTPATEVGAAPGDSVMSRLRANLSHAGARLIGYVEHQDSYNVTFSLNGRRYSPTIDKHSLTVLSAGICLDGFDRDFDLTSLVGVFGEI